MASPDPGAAMMDWWRRERKSGTVGGGPQQIGPEQADCASRLKDEKFKGALVEHIRTGGVPQPPAAQQGNGQTAPRADYQVPPSLSRVPGSAASGSGGDMSDASLFAYAMRGGR